MVSKFKGVGVALVTPFNHDFSIDFDSLRSILDHVNKEVDYLVVCGTTGEAATLNVQEQIELLHFVKGNSSKPIVFGYGGNNTHDLVNNIPKYPWEVIDGVLSVSPYYNKPSQQGIIQHYRSLADALPVPMILYNVPGRTGSKLTVDTTIELSKHQNIVGTKEASGDISQAFEIDQRTNQDFLLISGDDLLTLPLIAAGAQGVISVLANALPNTFASIFDGVLGGNIESARVQAEKILLINQEMYKEGSPSGIKQLLSYMNLCSNTVRLPMVPVSDELAGEIFEKYQIIKGTK